ncbi:MAG: DUF6456 domain-containing protein [Pseudomonadota bacterium]
MTLTCAVLPELPTIVPLPTLLVPVMQALVANEAYLAVGDGLAKAVVVSRDGSDAKSEITVDREAVDDLLLWGHITLVRSGQISLYEATDIGRSVTPKEALPPSTFRPIDSLKAQKENPVKILARKKMADGSPFLGPEHVSAADLLCEDYRLAGFEDHPVGAMRELVDYIYPTATDRAILDAHDRLVNALQTLGPDLGDIALRCCCLGEGVETAERRMGWSARSGKIVLRIALRRLVVHYEAVCADYCFVS